MNALKYFPAAAVALAATLAGGAAQAQQIAYAQQPMYLRAGPDLGYPVVSVLPQGAQVVVQGCLSDWQWCDILWGPHRGWAWAGELQSAWHSSWVPLAQVAPYVGVGVLSFSIDDYWHYHYRDRSWYVDRPRYRDHYRDHVRDHPRDYPRWERPPSPPPSPRDWRRQPAEGGGRVWESRSAPAAAPISAAPGRTADAPRLGGAAPQMQRPSLGGGSARGSEAASGSMPAPPPRLASEPPRR